VLWLDPSRRTLRVVQDDIASVRVIAMQCSRNDTRGLSDGVELDMDRQEINGVLRSAVSCNWVTGNRTNSAFQDMEWAYPRVLCASSFVCALFFS
jgi:hypothetical protein